MRHDNEDLPMTPAKYTKLKAHEYIERFHKLGISREKSKLAAITMVLELRAQFFRRFTETEFYRKKAMDQMQPKSEKAIMKELNEIRPGRTQFQNLKEAAVHTNVASWSTPRSSPNENRQTKQTPSQKQGMHGRNLASDVTVGPHDQESNNLNGNTPALLNPA